MQNCVEGNFDSNDSMGLLKPVKLMLQLVEMHVHFLGHSYPSTKHCINNIVKRKNKAWLFRHYHHQCKQRSAKLAYTADDDS